MPSPIRHAVLAALAGATLGAPHRGRSGFRRLAFYDPIPLRMSPHPALDAWWVWMSHLKGGKGKSALARSLFGQWGHLSEETAFGLSNMALGFSPSLSGSLNNPLSQGSSAFIRAIFWGLAFHGKPDEAADWAAMDASLDHSEEGVWLPSLAAWIIASARPGVTARQLISEAVQALPIQSQFHKILPLILAKAGDAEMPRELRLALMNRNEISDEFGAVYTFAWAAAGLIACPSSFGSPILQAAGCGGASDQSAALAAAVSALIHGDTPKEWLSPLGEDYVTSHALRGIQTEVSLTEFADLVDQSWTKFGREWLMEVMPQPVEAPIVVTPEPAMDSTEGTEVTVTEAPELPESVPAAKLEPIIVPDTVLMPPSGIVSGLLNRKEGFTSSEANGVEVIWNHLDPPVLAAGKSLRLVLSFINLTDQEVQLHPELLMPEGWKFATRMSPFRLPSGAKQDFPLVVVAPEGGFHERQFVRLKLGTAEHRTPVLPTTQWMWIGPFVNHEGTGFTTTYSAENGLDLKKPFVGRSEMMVKWEPLQQDSVWLDLEPEFKAGPGAILLAARFRFPHAGSYRITAAGSPGVSVTVDNEKLMAYHDEHKVDPRRRDRYTAQFVTAGESLIRLKVLRNKVACSKLALWFSTSEGQIVQPISLPLV